MHEKVSSVHIALHQGLVLLSIAATNDQVIFTGDEPDELLEPEYLALYASNLGLLEFLKFSLGRLLGLFDGDTGRALRLDFLRVGLLPNLKVLLNV